MKKTHIFGIIAILAIALGLTVLALSFEKEDSSEEESLAQMQKIQSMEQNASESEEEIQKQALTPENQKVLHQINELYSFEKQEYRETVLGIFTRYKADIGAQDTQLLFGLLEKSAQSAQLEASLKEKFGITLLSSDIQKLFDAKNTLQQETKVQAERLENFQEKAQGEIQEDSKKLIELTLKQSLKNSSSLTALERQKIVKYVLDSFFKKQETLTSENIRVFQKSLDLALKIHSPLSASQQEEIQNNIIKSLSEFTSELQGETNAGDAEETSYHFFNPLKKLFDVKSFFRFPETFAESQDLSAAQRQILILKTKIRIDTLVQQSIEAEIEFNKGNLTQLEYEEIIEENLQDMEELMLFKNNLEKDGSFISLDDIQRLKLGDYKDDSEEVKNLPILAYIKEKTGHVVVYNLNGSSKLGDTNMSLYSGYGIETLEDSTATIVFSDESVLRLDELSRVDITKPSQTEINVDVKKGNIWTRVLKPLLSGDRFVVRSDDVSLGVRGTSLYISKNDSSTEINVVDSFTSDNSPSVSVTDASGTVQDVSAGKKIVINASNAVSQLDETKTSLLQRVPEIREFSRQDLSYLTLLLDDRKRGVYNTPISIKNDGKNFIDKITGEINASLPKNTTEKQYILQNSEFHGQTVNAENMYALLKKDILMTNIKAEGGSYAGLVRDMNFEALETSLGSKRAIENFFGYKIQEDISKQTFSSAQQIEDFFTGFPVAAKQSDLEKLMKAKQNLVINGGSSILSSNITLPKSYASTGISWESSDTSIISNTGLVPPRKENRDVILTAKLKLGNFTTTKDFALTVVPRAATLEDVALAYQEYLTNVAGIITSDIPYPPTVQDELSSILGSDFTIEWQLDSYINDKTGVINQPTYSQGDKTGHKAKALFTQGTKTYTHNFDLPTIKSLPESADEIIARVSNSFWNKFITVNSSEFSQGTSTPKILVDTINYPSQEENVAINYTSNSVYYTISSTIGTKKPYCNIDKNIKITATFSLAGTSNITKAQSFIVPSKGGKIIGSECYILVAKADYNGPAGPASLQSLSLLGSGGYPDIKPTSSGVEFRVKNGKTGIFLKSGTSDFLSYDISSLELGKDGAIEMSVRGEDLKRNHLNATGGKKNYGLLSIPGKIYIRNREGKIGKIDILGAKYFENFISNGSKRILITKDKIRLGGEVINIDNIDIFKSILVGSHKNKTQQWGGIIENIKIYKKQ